MEVVITPSKNKFKKFDAVIDGKNKISFGHSQYQDFTTHKDTDRKDRYIDRHRKNEKWGKDGVETAGFYSKHVLWNKPTIEASVNDLNKNIKILNLNTKNKINYIIRWINCQKRYKISYMSINIS